MEVGKKVLKLEVGGLGIDILIIKLKQLKKKNLGLILNILLLRDMIFIVYYNNIFKTVKYTNGIAIC